MKIKFFNLLLPFSLFSILLFCLFFSFVSHGASEQDYFPIEQNKNGYFNSDKIIGIANYFDDTNYYIICYYQNYNYFLVRYPKSEKDAGMLCGEKSNNLTTWSLYKIGSINPQFYQFQWSDYGEGVINLIYFGSNGYGYWSNLPSSNYNTGWDYISNFIVFTNNTSTKQIVILYEEEPEYTDPENDTYPNNFEQPKFSDYVDYNTAPGFDSTSLESMVESLYNLLKWNFNTLVPGIVNYMIDGLNWALQKVINNIRNVIYDLQGAIEDFVDTINGWLSDIKYQIDYIIEPLNISTVNSTLQSTNFYNIKTQFSTFFTAFDTAFDFAEPDSFTIIINVQNIRTLYNFGCTSPITINLGANFLPIRQALRTFLWVLVSFGSVFVVERGLSNWLRGERNK